MENNVYEAPKADLATEEVLDSDYYIVSKCKFLVLFIATIGMYSVYWFYLNWSLQKKSKDLTVWPVMRGIFSIFFTHSLFRNVNDTLQAKGITHKWSHASLATMYVVSAVASSVSDRLSSANIGSPVTEFVGLGLFAVTAWVLYKAQIVINLASGDPEGESNSSYSGGNIAWIVVGVALWILVIVGYATIYMDQFPA